MHCSSPEAIRFINDTYYGNCAADVVTDCLSKVASPFTEKGTNSFAVISIPVRMLWNVRLPRRQKVLLIILFSLTVVVMIVSIIRVTIVGSETQDPDISWLYFWSNIEMPTGAFLAPANSPSVKLIVTLYDSHRDLLHRIVPPSLRQCSETTATSPAWQIQFRSQSSLAVAPISELEPREIGITAQEVSEK